MNNLYGDIPQKHKELANELIEMEKYFDSIPNNDPRASKAAQAYVAMAHDWIEMGLEERADYLFAKAETASPGYFKGAIWKDAEENVEFAYLVAAMRDYLNHLLISTLKSIK